MLGAALLPLLVLAAIAIFGRQETATTATSTTTIATATIVTTAALPSPPALKAAAPFVPQTRAPQPVVTSAKPSRASGESHGAVPVFDVNSLPTAKSRPGR